jgi:hypothetical protein
MKYIKAYENFSSKEKKYIRYEIQPRKWSSNVLIGVYMNDSGKEAREVIICPTTSKEIGDEYILKIKNYLEQE